MKTIAVPALAVPALALLLAACSTTPPPIGSPSAVTPTGQGTTAMETRDEDAELDAHARLQARQSTLGLACSVRDGSFPRARAWAVYLMGYNAGLAEDNIHLSAKHATLVDDAGAELDYAAPDCTSVPLFPQDMSPETASKPFDAPPLDADTPAPMRTPVNPAPRPPSALDIPPDPAYDTVPTE